MKRLVRITAIVAVVSFVLFFLLQIVGAHTDVREMVQSIGVFIGGAMIAVGVIAMIVASVSSAEKDKVYQGGFLALLGVAIAEFSLIALIASIALFAWMDFRGRSLK